MVPVFARGAPISLLFMYIFIWTPSYTPTKWYQVFGAQLKLTLCCAAPELVSRKNRALVLLSCTRKCHGPFSITTPSGFAAWPLSHKEMVISFPVMFKAGSAGTRTPSFTPSKSSAPPNLPATQSVAGSMLVRVPSLFSALSCAVELPVPSSKAQCPIRSLVGASSTGQPVGLPSENPSPSGSQSVLLKLIQPMVSDHAQPETRWELPASKSCGSAKTPTATTRTTMCIFAYIIKEKPPASREMEGQRLKFLLRNHFCLLAPGHRQRTAVACIALA